MNKFKDYTNKHKEIILFIITFIQLISYYYMKTNIYKKEKDSDIKKQIEEPADKISFNELIKDIENIDNIELIEVEDLQEKWYVQVSISGNKREVLENIEKMKNYNINSYNIHGSEGVLSVVLELFR